MERERPTRRPRSIIRDLDRNDYTFADRFLREQPEDLSELGVNMPEKQEDE